MRLSHYRLTERLGAGGMGEVYRAVDERLGRDVAVKLIAGAEHHPGRQARFLREAQAASALNHPSIVTVHDVGTHRGQPYLVMELIEGERFTELAARAIDAREALALCAEVADALDAAHRRGILHRDIKSDNLMRTRDGRVKVLDFGLAKLLDDSGVEPGELAAVGASAGDVPTAPGSDASLSDLDTLDALPGDAAILAPGPTPIAQLTRVGELIGTPAYMSPEQASGAAVDEASEVFSLGVVVYELLCGRRPFQGATLAEVIEAVRRAEVPAPSQVSSRALPAGADRLIARALAVDPGARPASMGAFAEELRALARGRRRARRWWPWIAAAGGVAGVTAAAFALQRRDTASAAPSASAADPVVSAVRRLTLDEGCEEYPSFSAGGRRLVFDGADDGSYALFELDLTDQRRRRLTDDEAWDFAASHSPDGAHLAFVRRADDGGQVMIMPADGAGEARRIAVGRMRPAWSPDGQAVWAGEIERPTRYRLADGEPDRRLTAPAGMGLLRVIELADGRVAGLAYPADLERAGHGVVLYPARGGDDTPTWLWRGSVEEVLALEGGDLLTTRRSASGTIELWRIPLDGRPPAVVPGSVVGATTGLAVSADGARIAWSDCTLDTGVALLVADGDTLRPAPVAGGRWVDQEPAGVPGTRRMLVVSGRGGPSAIWEVDLSGAAAARALPTPGLTPSSLAVSPDGGSIAFVDPQQGLFVMARDGGTPRRLVEGDAVFYPVFTHDGRSLLYQVDTDAGSRVHVIDVGGGPSRLVLDDIASEPAVSPAGDLIAVVVAEPGSEDGRPVLIEPATGRRRALPLALSPGWYHNLRFSPAGDRLLWLEAGKVLRELSLATGEVTRTYRSGTRQLVGVTYVGDDLVVAQTGWIGDLWLGELSRAR